MLLVEILRGFRPAEADNFEIAHDFPSDASGEKFLAWIVASINIQNEISDGKLSRSNPTMEKKRMGRPPKAPEDRAGPQVQFRVRGEVKAEIERQAKLVGRSISEECETRLTSSVEKGTAFAEIFGGEKRQRLLIAIGNAVRYADAASDGPEDAELQVNAAIIGLVELLAGKTAKALLDEASRSSYAWQTVAERVAALEQGDLQPIKPIAEILGR